MDGACPRWTIDALDSRPEAGSTGRLAASLDFVRLTMPIKVRVRSDQGGLGSSVGQPAMRHGVRGKEARASSPFVIENSLPSVS